MNYYGPFVLMALDRYAPGSDDLQDKFVNSDNPQLTIDELCLVTGVMKLTEDRIKENRERAWFDQHPWLK